MAAGVFFAPGWPLSRLCPRPKRAENRSPTDAPEPLEKEQAAHVSGRPFRAYVNLSIRLLPGPSA